MPKRIIAATLLLTFGVASCRTWTPLQGVADPIPGEIRVELLSGERVELMDARLAADTLVGRVAGREEAVRIPTDQIAAMETGEVSAGRTVLLILGVGLVAFALAVAQAWGDGGFDLGRGHR